MAASLVGAMSDPWEPEQYRDPYRDEAMAVIEAKAEGRTHEIESAPAMARVVDLASALEASVEAAKAARGRHVDPRVDAHCSCSSRANASSASISPLSAAPRAAM